MVISSPGDYLWQIKFNNVEQVNMQKVVFYG